MFAKLQGYASVLSPNVNYSHCHSGVRYFGRFLLVLLPLLVQHLVLLVVLLLRHVQHLLVFLCVAADVVIVSPTKTFFFVQNLN